MSWKTTSWKTTVYVGMLAAVVAVGCGQKPAEETAPAGEPETAAQTPPASEPMMMLSAEAPLQGVAGSEVSGKVTFTQENGGPVHIVADISGASPGMHGFHIHETGDCSAPDFTSAGGHFNPGDTIHGAPTDPEHHAGDLGNIEVGEDGTGHLEIDSSDVTLGPGPTSIIDLGLIVHEKADDLVSQPTGAAGARIACGVIKADGSGSDESGAMGEGEMKMDGEESDAH
ncbi:MAG: superoxide dismutase family protein [Acidobacteria bacterium]|nr:superoxide dismutase family protein [Acidobacteriota bacterium]